MKRNIRVSLAALSTIRLRLGTIGAKWGELLKVGTTKGVALSWLAFGLVLLGQVSMRAAESEDKDRKAINLDVAIDCRTFKYNRGIPGDQVVQGDSYLTKGKIFPAGTLRPGPQTNDPNDAGSLGSYVNRGQNAASFTEIRAGAPFPISFFTEYYMLNDGRALVSEGFNVSPTTARAAVVGGVGAFSGASGEASEVIIGVNGTGCPNIRVSFKLNKQKND
jgi:hypothetical protein